MDTQVSEKTVKSKVVKSTFWTPKYLSLREMLSYREKGKLDSTMAYQRGEGIGKWKKQEFIDEFIDSVFKGWFTGGFQWRMVANGGYEIVDSLQRITTIFRIYSDMHVPKTLKIPYDHLNGKVFSLWPTKDQDKFLDTKILVLIINEPDDKNIIEYFGRTNNGVSLTNSQKRRGLFADTFVALKDVLHHDLWDRNVVKMNMQQREIVIMQLINSIVSDSPNHETKSLVDWFIAWRPEESVIQNVFDRLDVLDKILDVGVDTGEDANENEDMKIIRRFCKKVHTESILFSLTGKENGDQIGEIYNRIVCFFSVPRSEEPEERASYKEVTYQDTSSRNSIMKRHDIMGMVIEGKIDYTHKESTYEIEEVGEPIEVPEMA